MRYTTIIDISEYPRLYANINVRLVYMHLSLKSGWHDTDRDLISISIRRLAFEVGISISACRHALSILESAKLLRRSGTVYQVTKWVLQETPTARSKTVKQAKAAEAREVAEQERIRREREREEQAQRIKQRRAQTGKTAFMEYYETQVIASANGDLEAQRFVRNERETYLAHQAAITKDKQ